MISKLKKTIISFIIMGVVSFAVTLLPISGGMSMLAPDLGLIYVLGLLFGPYGALGVALAIVTLNLINGFTLMETLPFEIFTFGVSYLGYRLWYSGFKTDTITKPKLDNSYHISLFLVSIIICGFIYSTVQGISFNLIFWVDRFYIMILFYFMSFTTMAFLYGIIGIWICNRYDCFETPKKSKRHVDKRIYQAIFCMIIITSIILATSFITTDDTTVRIIELIVLGIFLFAYLTKPFEYDITPNDKDTISGRIMRNFIIITFILGVLGIAISMISYSAYSQSDNVYLVLMWGPIITDTVLLLFLIPCIFILRYIEDKVVQPISSFSKIEGFIKENEKIDEDGLVKTYSKYTDEKTEIGTLARSYTELIKHNNNYIENIREIEGEKERINAELDIATKIQESSLPENPIKTNDFTVEGYSIPAKEVGGDFFDYYMVDDENLAIVIGDASGKGIPAAILSMITQFMIKNFLKQTLNPSEVLYSLNNQLSENNPECMFITLWLGIYNTRTKKVRFANGGHNPPLVKEDKKFKYLDIDTGLVLGITGDFDYINEEIILKDELIVYTDGITDATDEDSNIYGEDRLLKFLNEFKGDEVPIKPLISDVNTFSKGVEQFDDMTLLCLKLNK
ncbi:serine phosphatase [Methanobrevibacter ruminantium M1]|uniref:Serine phosphatase n=1 Tax=Methanobrevibacter ruminantium (strain ATCC 35063 / DSM 1093 / JCM 13430 / OCM 146 / M1) TaxID=634498 RepID=D3E4M2_METRM|nr:PP2C family protein-serine/threonine phosphatase [Methanobrevibacter ruminantium]ADC45918.1 serine phosphatase [Methanobrevibacter ruminantium M1]